MTRNLLCQGAAGLILFWSLGLCQGAENLVRNPGFEEGLKGWYTDTAATNSPSFARIASEGSAKMPSGLLGGASQTEGKTISIDRNVFQGPGGASLRIAGKATWLRQAALPFAPARTYRVSTWLRMDGFGPGDSANVQVVCMDKSLNWIKVFGMHTNVKTHNPRLDWTCFENTFVIPDNTARIDIILDTRGAMAKGAKAWFDNVCVEGLTDNRPGPGGSQSLLEIQNFRSLGLNDVGLFAPGEPIEIIMDGISRASEKIAVLAAITIRDFDGEIMNKKEESLEIPPAASFSRRLTFPAPKTLGFYGVQAVLKQGECLAGMAECSFCVLPRTERADPFFGFNANGRFDLRLAEAYPFLGAGTRGIWFIERNRSIWSYGDSVESRGEANDPVFYNKWVRELARRIRIVGFFSTDLMGTLDPQSQQEAERIKQTGQSPYSPAMYATYGRFVESVVTAYKDCIHEWMFSEEINYRRDDPLEWDRYQRMLKTGVAAARKADPGCVISAYGVGASDANAKPRFPVLRELMEKCGEGVNHAVIDIHSYPCVSGSSEGAIGPEKGELRDILVQAGRLTGEFGKGLAIAERGDAVIQQSPLLSDPTREQAALVARGHVIIKSVPDVRYYLYFTDFPWRPFLGDDWALWKAVNARLIQPRPAVVAYATAARLLAFTRDPVMITQPKDVYCFLFKKDQGCIAALWTIQKDPLDATFPAPEAMEVTDIMGRSHRIPKGNTILKVSRFPLFLSAPCSAEQMATALRTMKYPAMPVMKCATHFVSNSRLAVYVVNQTPLPLDTAVELNADKDIKPTERLLSFSVPGLGQNAAQFTLTGLVLPEMNGRIISGTATARNQKVRFETRVDLTPVPRLPDTVKIDGNLEECRSLRPLSLLSTDNLYPNPDVFANGLWTGPKDLSADLYLAWNHDMLYLAVEVTDDVFIQKQVEGKIWMNDCVQFALDMGSDALSPDIGGSLGYDNMNDYDFGIALTPKGPQFYSFVEPGRSSAGLKPYPVAVRREGNKTRYECGIPWKEISPLAPPHAGKAFGFNAVIFDIDDETRPTATYWMGITPGIAGGKNPSAFRTFYLAE